MVASSLVRERIDAGERLLRQIRASGFPITGAFWAEISDEESWYLFVVSPAVDSQGDMAAFQTLFPAVRGLPDWWELERFVRLIGESDPIARDAMEYQRRNPAAVAIRYPGRLLGGRLVNDAYLYPVASP